MDDHNIKILLLTILIPIIGMTIGFIVIKLIDKKYRNNKKTKS